VNASVGEVRIAGTVIIVIAVLPLIIEMSGASLTLRHVGDGLGWLGAGMLSSCLLLMIREPLVVRWFGGLDRMHRWHHAFGVWACIALLAHPIVLATAILPNTARALSLLSPIRWFPANALGWAALLGLTVGLAAALFWRLRYITWRRFHYCLSLAVLLGIAHVFAYRGLEASVLLAALPGILALGWRMLRTDRGFGARPYEVESSAHIASKTIEIALRPLATPLAVGPGQFVMVAFFEGPDYQGCGEFHPYTVCDSRANGRLVLAIKALGDCTTRIQSLRKGVAARVQGPYGRLLAATPTGPSLWIAGGIGVTPFIAKLRAGDLHTSTSLIYAYRSADEAPYLAELQAQADRQKLFELRTLLSQDDLRPLFALLDNVHNLRSREIHISGPPPFVRALIQELLSREVPRSNLHFDEFA
jgi:predicted ferric reductase